jgi:hypothetical protein
MTPSGVQTVVGVVEAGSGATYIGQDLQDVLAQWRGTTGITDMISGTDSRATVKEKIRQIRKLLDEIETETGTA